jgi:putative chitinase
MLPVSLTLANMQRMWKHGDQHVPGLIEGIARSAPAVLERYGIPTELTVAHMMGQFSHECGAGLEMEENLSYSAQRLLQVWPHHFTPGMAQKYAHNPRMIADIAYGGRMGNAAPPSDDGWNYRGRGLSQTTGRENYHRLATVSGIDVVTHPELLSDPDFAFELGVADFVKLCNCVPAARRDDVVGVTRLLNGGLNGLAERRMWTAAWKRELGVA